MFDIDVWRPVFGHFLDGVAVIPVAYSRYMEKKLIKLGGSVALVIDKRFRAQLDLLPTSLVQVTCDGQRLTIEKTGDRADDMVDPSPVAQQRRAGEIVRALVVSFGMSKQTLPQLTCAFQRGLHPPNLLAAWAEELEWTRATPAELRLLRRLEAAYWVLRDQRGWDAAVKAALEAEPFDPNDPGEQSIGKRRN